ncbi:hypothetical protein KP509_39G048400 [Ceratopteris richardii]|uniref:Uncharacterized protein n=1 Tax=Ceratopteris richardii TaxID=49495 RepID=A0A8T2Q120_CERRI|nr:hypothetical protein KP509_39G048400 [Ceratopteris richardii]
MANKFAAPFRSIKYCTNAGCVAMGLCNDFSSGNSSPRFSCSSGGEYSPEFIRSTLENNMLLNHVSLR